MIEARDTVDPLQESRQTMALLGSILGLVQLLIRHGDILASGVEAAADGWVKLWVDLRTSDGEHLRHHWPARRSQQSACVRSSRSTDEVRRT